MLQLSLLAQGLLTQVSPVAGIESLHHAHTHAEDSEITLKDSEEGINEKMGQTVVIRHRIKPDKLPDWRVLLASNALLMASYFYIVSTHSPLCSSPPHFPAHSINLHYSTLPLHQNIPNPQVLFRPILSVTKSRYPTPKPCLGFRSFVMAHQL